MAPQIHLALRSGHLSGDVDPGTSGGSSLHQHYQVATQILRLTDLQHYQVLVSKRKMISLTFYEKSVGCMM